MNKFILSLLLISSGILLAQQEPHYTQYMYNMNIINPGYMINEPGLLEVGTLYRKQWTGIDGSPKTANIFANIPLNNKIEISVNYLNDKIGDQISLVDNLFNIDAAYKIKLNEKLDLSLGMKAGWRSIQPDFSKSNVVGDPLFGNDKSNSLMIGSGLFLMHDNYYVGLSAPNLLQNKIDINDEVQYQDKPHLFLMGGYIFEINEMFKLKPSTVIKQVFGAPLTFDISANALYNDTFEIGVSYRYQDAFTGMVGVEIFQDFRIGYAYDFNTSALNDYNNGSHELILTYRFDVLGLSKRYSSPRFY